MKSVFLIIATALMLYSIVPYVRGMVRGDSKPNLVSWITWTLLTSITASAQIAAGEYMAAIFTASVIIEAGVIVAVGVVRRAYVRYTAFEVWCQLGAIVGLILWQVFDSPAVGVFASVIVDCIGALPTLRHAWRRPSEEVWRTYALAGAAGVFGILALDSYNWVSLPYAIYVVLIDIVLVWVIVYRRTIGRKMI